MNVRRLYFSTILLATSFLLLTATPQEASAQASSVPAKIPVEGRLSNPDGTPVLAVNAQIRVRIHSPGTENCMLYSEVFVVNLSTSGGRFSVMLNAGEGTVDSSYGWSFADVFKNTSPFPTGAPNCATGSIYTPLANQGRRVQISIHDGTMWDAFPSYALNSSAYALEAGNADTVGGLSATSFLRPDTNSGNNLTQTNLTTLFSPINYPELNALLAGTSTRYAPMSGGNVSVAGQLNLAGNMTLAPQRTLQLGTFTTSQQGALALASGDAGKMWFNTTSSQLMYWNGVSTQMVGMGDFRSDGSVPMLSQLQGYGGSTQALPAYSFMGSSSTGIHSAGPGHIGLVTNGTEKLFVDGNTVRVPQGNKLEIGQFTGSVSMLQVYNPGDPGAANTDVQFHNGSSTSAGPSLRLLKSRTQGPSNSGDRTGDLRFTALDSSSNPADVAGIYSTVTNPASGTVSGSLKLSTSYNGTMGTRIFVQPDGNIGIGMTTPAYLLHLATDSAAKPGTSTWTVASDIRLKDIRAPYTRSLEALEGIETVYFRYKEGNALGLPSDKEFVGIRAQDVKAAIPEAVRQDEKGFYHVTNDAINWTVFNAVKELYHRWTSDSEQLHQEIDELKKKNEELEARLQRLEAKVNQH